MKRFGQIIRLKPGCHAEYKRLHDNIWPEVVAAMRRANMQNYTIYHWNGMLFGTFEYVGDDFEADMKAIANDPVTQRWWQHTDATQQPISGNSMGSIQGGWWTDMEEMFHVD
jgi:L-rhamnose mutarotase